MPSQILLQIVYGILIQQGVRLRVRQVEGQVISATLEVIIQSHLTVKTSHYQSNVNQTARHALKYSVRFKTYEWNGQHTEGTKWSLFLWQIFAGNFDRDSIVSHEMLPPFYANLVKIHPVTYGWMSMRIELYGCPIKVSTASDWESCLRGIQWLTEKVLHVKICNGKTRWIGWTCE